MKNRINILSTVVILMLANFSAEAAVNVTYHEPNHQFEKNLNVYGTGVSDWEKAEFMRLTMADSHLFHYWANIPSGEKMPLLNASKVFDVSKFSVEDVIPNKQITMYNMMRDRADMQSYVIMNNKGEIVAEDYWNNTRPDTKHHLMSANKSFTAMNWAMLEKEGLVSSREVAGTYVKELRGTPWGKIPMQNYLDMTSGINTMYFTRKGYHNWGMPDGSSCWDSAMSTVAGYNGLEIRDGKLVPPADAAGEITTVGQYLFDFAHRAAPEWKAGEKYQYRGLNTEIVATAMTRVTGLTLAEIYAKYLWKKGGFNSSAAMYVNQEHESLGSGSLNVTARDLAIGSYIMANGGKNWKGEQIIPRKFVNQVLNGDDNVKAAWDKVSYEAWEVPTGAWYKNQFRTMHDEKTGRTISFMVGVNGQFSAWDHDKGYVISTMGAYRVPTGKAFIQIYIKDIILSIFEEMDKQGI